jgi:hypothetical protein
MESSFRSVQTISGHGIEVSADAAVCPMRVIASGFLQSAPSFAGILLYETPTDTVMPSFRFTRTRISCVICIGLPQSRALLCLPDGHARFDAAALGGIAGGQRNAVPLSQPLSFNITRFSSSFIALSVEFRAVND